MAFTRSGAAEASRNPMAAGVLSAIATTDELIGLLPFFPTQGEAFSFNREKALPTAEFVATNHGSLSDSAATYDRVTVPVRELITDIDMYLFALEMQGDTIDQRATQLKKKLKACDRLIAQKAITGRFATGATMIAVPGFGGVYIDAIVIGPNQDTD